MRGRLDARRTLKSLVADLRLKILFCSDNKVGFNLMNFIQHFEVIITAVKDVIRAWFISDFNHNYRICTDASMI